MATVMAPPDFSALEELLARTIGLEPNRLGRAPLEHAVYRRMQVTGIASAAAYAERLTRDDAEHQALVEELVVPETWFFRDEGPFKLLQHVALTQWANQHPQPQVRVLCAPCSTGEEPFSVVIALIRAGMRPESIHVDAVDISGRLLEVGKAGVYGLNSFRGKELAFRETYCQELAPGVYEMDPTLGKRIHWHRMNILHGLPPAPPALDADESGYDFIFCRNLFIYLTTSARNRLLGNFRNRLKPSGIFFVGHAEAMSLDTRHFVPTGDPGQFAYRLYNEQDKILAAGPPKQVPWYADRVSTGVLPYISPIAPTPVPTIASIPRVPPSLATTLAQTGGVPAPDPVPPASTRQHSPAVVLPHAMARRVDAGVASTSQSIPDAASLVARALKLADAGKYEEAERKCEEALTLDRFHAGAHCLFGVIAEAKGGISLAERCYRRAVYLDPRHRQALVHLSLLMHKRGNAAEARVLRERADRLR